MTNAMYWKYKTPKMVNSNPPAMSLIVFPVALTFSFSKMLANVYLRCFHLKNLVIESA